MVQGHDIMHLILKKMVHHESVQAEDLPMIVLIQIQLFEFLRVRIIHLQWQQRGLRMDISWLLVLVVMLRFLLEVVDLYDLKQVDYILLMV